MGATAKKQTIDEPTGTSDVRHDRRKTAKASPRIEAALLTARGAGLLGEKSARLGVRVSPVLVKRAKELTGIDSDSALIEFALASVVGEFEDEFPRVMKELSGTVDPSIKLGY